MEKIVGLIDGPVGSLVGAGLQIIVSKITSGSRSPNDSNGRVSNSTPRDSEYQRVMKVYDQVEAHLHGAMKVLKPAMEIKEIMMNQKSKSADVRSEKLQQSEINYYTPQKNRSQSGQRSCKCSDKNLPKSRYDQSFKENSSNASNSKSFICSSPLSKKNRSTSSAHSISKLSNISKIRQNDTTENGLKNCGKCGIGVKVVKKLAVTPCGHTFCYRCIPPKHFSACPICKKPLLSSHLRSLNY